MSLPTSAMSSLRGWGSTTRLQSHVRLSGHHKGEGVMIDTSVEELFDGASDEECQDCGEYVDNCECPREEGDDEDEDGGEA